MIHAILLMTMTAAGPAAGPAAADTVQCRLNAAKPAPCKVTMTATSDGTHSLAFAAGAASVRIVAKSQTGWWSGTLNGKPAMGFELNRGYTRFSTTDLTTTFDWWYPGKEHGSY